MDNIENKVIVITGASSGLGEASAKALSAKGAILVLAARRLERIDALVEEFSKNGKKALAIQTDVTDFTQMQALMKEERLVPSGLHHEIYLGDPRRTKPEKLKTILRVPVARA